MIRLPPTVRRSLKHSLEQLLVFGGPAAAARRLASASTLVLAYHNIVPDGEQAGADRSLHLPRRRFTAQLEALARTHEVVPLADVLRDVPRRSVRPRAAITFDDGSAGALTAGVSELGRLGLPATLFVTPGRLGRHAFWWDRLGVLGEGEVPAEIRDHALTALHGQDEAISAWAADRAIPAASVPEHARTATEQELASALSIPGLTVAAHTWSHPNLATLEEHDLRAELERPLEWLRARWPDTLPLVSYPYGLTSPRVAEVARRAGYDGGLLISGGWLAPGKVESPFLLPRVNVPAGVSQEGFVLLASGLRGR